MLKLSKFCAYSGQKLAQLEEKIAQARWPRWPLFASLIETSVHPDVAAEPTTKAEVGEEAATKDEPGEPPLREFKPKDTLDRLLQLIFQMTWN